MISAGFRKPYVASRFMQFNKERKNCGMLFRNSIFHRETIISLNKKYMRFITILTAAFLSIGSIAVAQNNTESQAAEMDFTTMLTEDLGLDKNQRNEVAELNKQTYQKIANIEDKYKLNDNVYQNKLRLIFAERDIAMKDILTLEQYAIYMNNQRKYQSMDMAYEDEEWNINQDADGDVEIEGPEGDIDINDDKIKIENKERGTKTKITEDKVKYEKDEADVKMKVKDDKVKVKTDDGKEVVEEDEVHKEKGDMELDIDEDEDE